jgi:hypothetical protein
MFSIEKALFWLSGQGSAKVCWSASIFSTKFKQIIPFGIISWSDSKRFRQWWLFCRVMVRVDQCRPAGAEH